MPNFDEVQQSLLMSIAVAQKEIKDVICTSDIPAKNLAEVGETIEDKEIKQLEKSWSREWICPMCGESKGDAVFFSKVKVKVIDGAIESVEENLDGITDVVHELGEDDDDPSIIDDNTPLGEFSFDSEEAFDEHMLTVHGIVIEKNGPELTDKAVMDMVGPKEYGGTPVHLNEKNKKQLIKRSE
jgi:hypothetical protein